MSAALHPRERDPRQFSYGLCLVECVPFRGVNGFHWFRAESEAAEFLHNGIWLELSTWDDLYPGTRELFQEALRGRCTVSQEWLRPLEAKQHNLLVIWHGTFQELLEGADALAENALELYAESPEAREATTRDATPFIAFLRRSYR